ncbi:MAG: hypothetical protein OJF59_002471 [Cytophagales bacterium]|nr:MAG: hypothetical protein OJF59_002471 [Cytophagales bacterium]
MFYGQAGYLVKKELLGKRNGMLMPCFQLQSAKFNRLNGRRMCMT